MPPLRERPEDIPILAQYFVSKFAVKCKVKAKKISAEAMAHLTNYDWPGNVRELENAIERALVLGVADTIRPEDLPESVLEKDVAPGVLETKYHVAVKQLKKHLILTALEEAKGNYTDAAKVLGVHANYLHRLVRNLNLRTSVRSLPISHGGPTEELWMAAGIVKKPGRRATRRDLYGAWKNSKKARGVQVNALPANRHM